MIDKERWGWGAAGPAALEVSQAAGSEWLEHQVQPVENIGLTSTKSKVLDALGRTWEELNCEVLSAGKVCEACASRRQNWFCSEALNIW